MSGGAPAVISKEVQYTQMTLIEVGKRPRDLLKNWDCFLINRKMKSMLLKEKKFLKAK